MTETEELLKEQVEYTLNRLDLLEPSEDGYKEATERAEKLYKAMVDAELRRQEAELKKDELNLKEAQLKEEKLGRISRIAVDCGLGLLTLGFNWIWLRKGFRFEETGAYTSNTFKTLWQRFIKK